MRHLRPLGIAAHVTQAGLCRLYDVVLSFGYLVLEYARIRDAPNSDSTDVHACNLLIGLVEKRWSDADQEACIASLILNPFYHTEPLADHPQLNPMGCRILFSRLYERMMGASAPPEFDAELVEYLNKTGRYADMTAVANFVRVDASRQVC